MSRASAIVGLFLTEGEIAVRVGMPLAEWQAAASTLEKAGLPKADTLFNHRRYWPAVKAFLDRRAGLFQDASPLVLDGEEMEWKSWTITRQDVR